MPERVISNSIDNLSFKKNEPTIAIVGAGLAGLMTAINTLKKNPNLRVIVFERKFPQSNTRIAGMRIAERSAGSLASLPEEKIAELIWLLAEQNNGIVTEPMRIFASTLTSQLAIWNQILLAENPELVSNNPAWFGPQWGKLGSSGATNRGISLLATLKNIAIQYGAEFVTAKVTSLKRNGDVTALELSSKGLNYIFSPDFVVLANGNATGRLFFATNVPIEHSGNELIFDAGLPLEGGTLMMFHPFGKCHADGDSYVGCHETDNLADAKIFYLDGSEDHQVEQWLQLHQTHYHFKEITQRFLAKGGVVRIIYPDGSEDFARVSMHYLHLGALTTNGVLVENMQNLAVAGDAGGLPYFTGGNNRLPGFALGHCLVSSEIIAEELSSQSEGGWQIIDRRRLIQNGVTAEPTPDRNNLLRKINTDHVLNYMLSNPHNPEVLTWWKQSLTQLNTQELVPLSLAIVSSLEQAGLGQKEPIRIIRK